MGESRWRGGGPDVVRGWVSHRPSQPPREIRCACLPIGQRCAAPCTLFCSAPGNLTARKTSALRVHPVRKPELRQRKKIGVRSKVPIDPSLWIAGEIRGISKGRAVHPASARDNLERAFGSNLSRVHACMTVLARMKGKDAFAFDPRLR
jgi:hypothetical protein